MEADLQLQLGHIKGQKERVATLAADLQRAQEENARFEPKLTAAHKKKDALERDLQRLQVMERSLGFDVDMSVLKALDQPMEFEILTAAEYQNKLERLLDMMNELLMRTVANYNTAHAEQEDQERDFEQRVADAVQARNMLTAELQKTQQTVETRMVERIREYEAIQQLEEAVSTMEAEIWLSRADSHRLADQLAMLSTKPRTLPCKSGRRDEAQRVEEVSATSFNVLKEKMDLLFGGGGGTGHLSVETIHDVSEEVTDPPEMNNKEGLTKEKLQDLLPQILGVVSPTQRFPRSSADNRSVVSPARGPSACDLTDVVRAALQMFNLDLE